MLRSAAVSSMASPLSRATSTWAAVACSRQLAPIPSLLSSRSCASSRIACCSSAMVLAFRAVMSLSLYQFACPLSERRRVCISASPISLSAWAAARRTCSKASRTLTAALTHVSAVSGADGRSGFSMRCSSHSCMSTFSCCSACTILSVHARSNDASSSFSSASFSIVAGEGGGSSAADAAPAAVGPLSS